MIEFDNKGNVSNNSIDNFCGTCQKKYGSDLNYAGLVNEFKAENRKSDDKVKRKNIDYPEVNF